MKKLLFSALMVCASSLTTFANDGILGIRADKSQKSVPLSEIMTIKVNGGDNPSMTVNKNDGTSVDGFQTIIFNVDLSSVNDNAAAPSIQVYPNPVESIIYVNGLDKDANIKVISTDGKTAKQVIGQQIEVSDLVKGMYLLSVDGRMIKFIKK